ncbi:hypothetical protein LOC54_04370 [Acetobacter sp. AN02]|uniref:hypothetical protein n=1 Tax=Acetobacter sp. AN02 TaxID=2894186 RepID=UPI00243420FE|nr:hypothetical protein [Acetobacter sp. AN02]MDG6094352.1 hypothetical protein [Acetobacter sp. AN02]
MRPHPSSSRARRPAHHPALLSGGAMICLSLLGGCQHRDPAQLAMDTFHQAEGGLVAQQRLPPPGQNQPYPKIGLTPSTRPVLPSQELRDSITNHLVTARNYTHRVEAQNGSLVPDFPPPPPGQPAAQKPSSGTAPPAAGTPATGTPPVMSAMLNAAGQDPTPPAAQTSAAGQTPAPQAPASAPAPKPAATQTRAAPAGTRKVTTEQDEPELQIPDLSTGIAKRETTTTGALPEIPAGPPPAPVVPGMIIPADNAVPDPVRPAYDLSAKDGTRFHFMAGSDQLAPGQDNILTKVVNSRRNATLFVFGSGGAVTMSAADQARAIELALLRARTLADALIRRGVPPQSVKIRAESFGSGARVSTRG